MRPRLSDPGYIWTSHRPNVHFIGVALDLEPLSRAATQAQIDALRSIPCDVAIEGDAPGWGWAAELLDAIATTRDRGRAAPFLIATAIGGSIARIEVYTDNNPDADILLAVDARSRETSERDLEPTFAPTGDVAWDALAEFMGYRAAGRVLRAIQCGVSREVDAS